MRVVKTPPVSTKRKRQHRGPRHANETWLEHYARGHGQVPRVPSLDAMWIEYLKSEWGACELGDGEVVRLLRRTFYVGAMVAMGFMAEVGQQDRRGNTARADLIAKTICQETAGFREAVLAGRA